MIVQTFLKILKDLLKGLKSLYNQAAKSKSLDKYIL